MFLFLICSCHDVCVVILYMLKFELKKKMLVWEVLNADCFTERISRTRDKHQFLYYIGKKRKKLSLGICTETTGIKKNQVQTLCNKAHFARKLCAHVFYCTDNLHEMHKHCFHKVNSARNSVEQCIFWTKTLCTDFFTVFFARIICTKCTKHVCTLYILYGCVAKSTCKHPAFHHYNLRLNAFLEIRKKYTRCRVFCTRFWMHITMCCLKIEFLQDVK